MQICLGKSLSICRLPRRILNAALIIDKSSFLSGYMQIHLQFFCKSKLQLRQKDQDAMQMDRSSTPSETSFHGLIVSPLSSQLIVLLFLRNSNLQRDSQQTFFRQCFCELLESSCSTSKAYLQHIWQRCFPVNFVNFHPSFTPFLQNKHHFYRTPPDNCFCFQLFPATLLKWGTTNSVWKTSDEYYFSRNTNLRSTVIISFLAASIFSVCFHWFTLFTARSSHQSRGVL